MGQARRIRFARMICQFFVQLFWGPAQSPPLRVNDAVFAFIIYFFRLLFELLALILDQPNNFYWFQISTLFYMWSESVCVCVCCESQCVCGRRKRRQSIYWGSGNNKIRQIFYDDAIVVSGSEWRKQPEERRKARGEREVRWWDGTHLRTSLPVWWVLSPAFSGDASRFFGSYSTCLFWGGGPRSR